MPITLGLISDTHMHDRCRELPATVANALAGVDLILHAGDVGALSTLDILARIAPVMAVHGNDELENAPSVLPTRHVLFVAGRRILLTHGNHPDPATERANRKIDDWRPKLAWWAGLAREVEASIMVYGHTHIPWDIEVDGVHIINPGAIASGSHFTRQGTQTVARLTLNGSAAPEITYINLADLSIYTPTVDPDAGFNAANINEPIVTPDVLASWDWLHHQVYEPAPLPTLNALRQVMFRCHDGEIARADIPDVVAALLNAPDVPDEIKMRVRNRWPQS